MPHTTCHMSMSLDGCVAGPRQSRDHPAAKAIDELVLDVVPVLLGDGERLFDGVDGPGLEPIEVIHSPHATHIRYRIGH